MLITAVVATVAVVVVVTVWHVCAFNISAETAADRDVFKIIRKRQKHRKKIKTRQTKDNREERKKSNQFDRSMLELFCETKYRNLHYVVDSMRSHKSHETMRFYWFSILLILEMIVVIGAFAPIREGYSVRRAHIQRLWAICRKSARLKSMPLLKLIRRWRCWLSN